jgi:hypothetical protein
MRSRALKAGDVCQLAGCGKSRAKHHDLEASGVVNHEFSSDGQLVAIERDKPKGRPRGNAQRSSGRVTVGTAGGDPVLRYLLVNKGILSVAELEEAETLLKATGLLGPTQLPHSLGTVDRGAAPDA